MNSSVTNKVSEAEACVGMKLPVTAKLQASLTCGTPEEITSALLYSYKFSVFVGGVTLHLAVRRRESRPVLS